MISNVLCQLALLFLFGSDQGEAYATSSTRQAIRFIRHTNQHTAVSISGAARRPREPAVRTAAGGCPSVQVPTNHHGGRIIMSTKITPEHLARAAYVYIRQSTPDQVRNHPESRRRQYALQEHARQLGWTDVIVIDEDLGRSASGTARSGFERLLNAVCAGNVGVVLALEISRLARNGREWHTLMEFCAIVGTLLVDEHGVYEPRHTNDRLLLGVKSTIAEMELSTFRQRSQEALKLKAARGELYTKLAVGYVPAANGIGIDKDPDERVRQALELTFRKFAELGSIRQVLIWYRHESITVPFVHYDGQGRTLQWKLPVYNTLRSVLTNPIYAGAYSFGRTASQAKLEDGHKRIVQRRQRNDAQWRVLIREHHEGYISWESFKHNQQIIADNTNMFGEHVRGAIRRGETLLAGLLRCAHCARRLRVTYGGTKGVLGRYECMGTGRTQAGARCMSFGALRVDEAVCEEVLRRLQPLGIEAALQAIKTRERAGDDTQRQVALTLEQARYEATLARRQYDAVDPLNRLVAAELERRWNERLATVSELEDKLAALEHASPPPLSEAEREQLLALGADLPKVWNHPNASAETRKRILRAVLKEIVVRVEGDELHMKLHWHGGDHTALVARKNRSGGHRFVTTVETTDLIRALARLLPDAKIAALLNRLGKRTAKGHTWTVARVRVFRNDHGIAVYRDGERPERGEVNLNEAATLLQISQMSVLRLIQRKILPAQQPCVGAPWSIRRSDLEIAAVQQAVKPDQHVALTANPDQSNLNF
jgi:DNA invertase Pin-like site-specific DNA recombinase